MRQLGKAQYRHLMLFQPLPQVMGIRLGNSTPLAVLSGRNGWEFLLAPSQDIAIAFLSILVLALGEFFLFRFATLAQVSCSRRFMFAAQT